MCKRGAIVMARRNASFEQILQHYYRGVSIVHTTTEAPAAAEPSESQAVPISVEPSKSQAAPISVELPVAPQPRTRPRKEKAPTVEFVESPKPKRRAQRRVQPREIEEPPAPIIEITAVPASVALKRIQITPSAPATETESVAPAETPTAPAVAATPAPAEAVAPTVELTPQPRRVELDFPVQESAPSPGWRLAQAEPITPTPSAPTPPSMPAPQSTEVVIEDTPSMIARRVHVDHLPGARMICGAMPRAGIVVMIEDTHGENTIVYSGSAPQYGEGGFEMSVAEDGKYVVTIGGRGIEVQVEQDTVFIHA
jgi:hypothetical protein